MRFLLVCAFLASACGSDGPVIVRQGSLLRPCEPAFGHQDCDDGQICGRAIVRPGFDLPDPVCVAIFPAPVDTVDCESLVEERDRCPYSTRTLRGHTETTPEGTERFCVCQPNGTTVAQACASLTHLSCEAEPPASCCSGKECGYVLESWGGVSQADCFESAADDDAPCISNIFDACRPHAFPFTVPVPGEP